MVRRAFARHTLAAGLVVLSSACVLGDVAAQEGFAPPPLTIPRQSGTIQELPISKWLSFMEVASGKFVAYPSRFGDADEDRLRFLGNLRALNYPVIKAVFESNGYQVTEELRSNLIQVRHNTQRVRNRVTKRVSSVDDEDVTEVEAPSLTWLCALRYLDAASTYDVVRQVLRRRSRDGKVSSEHLRVELVAPVNALVLTGDDQTIRRVQDVIRTIDVPPINQLPLLRCYTPYHASPVEIAERLSELTGFPKVVLYGAVAEDDPNTLDSGASRGADTDGRYCRLLVVSDLEKIVVDTNDQHRKELIDFLMPLIDRRDALARASTHLYRVQNVQVEVAVKSLLEFVWGGGAATEQAVPTNDEIATRIITHEGTNSILIQAPVGLYESMSRFLESMDAKAGEAKRNQDAPTADAGT
ncbi:MAG: hypothetical protein AB7O52_16380 [Planctomycetota bacterium]